MTSFAFAALLWVQLSPTDGSTATASVTRTSSASMVAQTSTAASPASDSPADEGSWTPSQFFDFFDLRPPRSDPKPTGEVPSPSEGEGGVEAGRPLFLWAALLWASILFGVGRWLRTRPLSAPVRRALPLVEIGLWAVWLGLSSSQGLAQGQYAWVAVAWLLAVPPLLGIARQGLGGLHFWFGSGLEEGAAVEVDGHQGSVRRASAFDLEIETEGGWLVRVPYAGVSQRVRVRSQALAHRVRFDVPLSEQQEVRVSRTRLVELVLSSTWSRLEAPLVELSGDRTLRVEASAVDEGAKSLLVSDVLRAWAELRPPAPRPSSGPRGPSVASS